MLLLLYLALFMLVHLAFDFWLLFKLGFGTSLQFAILFGILFGLLFGLLFVHLAFVGSGNMATQFAAVVEFLEAYFALEGRPFLRF